MALGVTAGMIGIRFDDLVTGGVVPGQCVMVSPGGQVCDGAVEDGDVDAGELGTAQAFGSYTVEYDPVNQPADRLVKAPSLLACELTAQAPLCSVAFSFNPTFIAPPSYPIPANLFLTAQGESFAPASCRAATDVVTFSYTLPSPPSTPVGAFETEAVFDPALLCVEIDAGAYFHETPGAACFVSDGHETPGRAYLGCRVFGDPETTSTSPEMAVIHIRAQPVQYEKILPSQDNGVNALVLNQKCNLADLNGEPLPTPECDDYEITIRWLEGDVDGDCAVDVRDEQLVAFRWLPPGWIPPPIDPWLPRLDLEPSYLSPPGDGDVDIKDLQFVHGRHGSTCTAPHPLQPPRSSYGPFL